jgi:hypothetical protein
MLWRIFAWLRGVIRPVMPSAIWARWPRKPRNGFLTAFGIVLVLWGLTAFMIHRGEVIVAGAAGMLENEVWDNIKLTHWASNLNIPVAAQAAQTVQLQKVDFLLKNEYRDINRRALHHLMMVEALAKYAYAQDIMEIITAAAAAVFLFFVGRRGFNNVDSNVLIASTILAAAAAAYLAVPTVMQLSDNLKANANLYSQLMIISDQIRALSQSATNYKPDELQKVLAELDIKIATANQISFTFDVSKAPSAQDILGGITATRPAIQSTSTASGTAPPSGSKQKNTTQTNTQ